MVTKEGYFVLRLAAEPGLTTQVLTCPFSAVLVLFFPQTCDKCL